MIYAVFPKDPARLPQDFPSWNEWEGEYTIETGLRMKNKLWFVAQTAQKKKSIGQGM